MQPDQQQYRSKHRKHSRNGHKVRAPMVTLILGIYVQIRCTIHIAATAACSYCLCLPLQTNKCTFVIAVSAKPAAGSSRAAAANSSIGNTGQLLLLKHCSTISATAAAGAGHVILTLLLWRQRLLNPHPRL
jgi:hypothetical protein